MSTAIQYAKEKRHQGAKWRFVCMYDDLEEKARYFDIVAEVEK